MKTVAVVLLVGFLLTLPFIVAPEYKITVDEYYILKDIDGWEGITGPVKGEPKTFTFTNKYEMLHNNSFKLLPIGTYGYDHPVLYNPLLSDESYIFDYDTIQEKKFNITFSGFRDKIGVITGFIGSINSFLRHIISDSIHFLSSIFSK